MRNRWINPMFAILTMLAFSPVILAQTAGQPGAKKKAHTADLNGVWANITESGPTFNPKESPSFQPWAEAKWKANKNDDPGQPSITNGRVDLDPTVPSCFPTGMPRLMTEVFPFEIIQARDRVLILFEKDYAVSHIVVDTIGLKDITWLDRAGHPHSDALHIVGRIRRVNRDRLQIDWTFDDPKAFTKPWTGRTIYRYHPDWTLAEFISCEDRLLHGGESLEQKAVKGHE